jgi:hypothetical protein
MPRQVATNAAQKIVDEASVTSIDLLAELAEPLAEYILDDYGREDWHDSPLIETLARVAAIFEAERRDIPPPILVVLRKAAEAGKPIGVA